MILELCKGVYCVDLGESFQTHMYLQILASIQPRTSPVKFARSSGAAPLILEEAQVFAFAGTVRVGCLHPRDVRVDPPQPGI